MLKNMKNFIVTFLILLSVWILLNNSLEADVLISGGVIAFLLAFLNAKQHRLFDDLKLTPKSLVYTIMYFIVFFIELVKSNIDVTLRVISPKLRINPGIVEVKTKLKSKYARMILANSITLTPGTLTVEVVDDSFFIHWIDVENEDIQEASNKIVKNFEKYLEVIYG
jgi:multicomponent Na+:H+ antiporter subunit E